MRWGWLGVSLAGIAAFGLGILWVLQGSDLVHIEPVACAAECDTITGHRPGWQAAGAGVATAGALVLALAVRRLRR